MRPKGAAQIMHGPHDNEEIVQCEGSCDLQSIFFKPLEAFFREPELRFLIAEALAEKNLAAFNLDKLCTQRRELATSALLELT